MHWHQSKNNSWHHFSTKYAIKYISREGNTIEKLSRKRDFVSSFSVITVTVTRNDFLFRHLLEQYETVTLTTSLNQCPSWLISSFFSLSRSVSPSGPKADKKQQKEVEGKKNRRNNIYSIHRTFEYVPYNMFLGVSYR